ncbi:MAG: class IV adenylate cyclase [Candidatus Parcubacteria bacterium]|nr:class IV adenylate cyclase [Candidatus Parcubacteria bacterium]
MKNVEVEIQAKIKNPKNIEKKLRKVGKFIKTRQQKDIYFVTPQRNFFAKKMPVEYLRVRYEKDRNHLNYSFLHFKKNGWLNATDEYETLVEKPEIIEAVFKKIGLISKITVIKTRKYFICRDFEVTIDAIKGLGNFMEVEAKKNFGTIDKTRKACSDFLNSLGVEYEVKKEMGYPRMLYQKLYKK